MRRYYSFIIMLAIAIFLASNGLINCKSYYILNKKGKDGVIVISCTNEGNVLLGNKEQTIHQIEAFIQDLRNKTVKNAKEEVSSIVVFLLCEGDVKYRQINKVISACKGKDLKNTKVLLFSKKYWGNTGKIKDKDYDKLDKVEVFLYERDDKVKYLIQSKQPKKDMHGELSKLYAAIKKIKNYEKGKDVEVPVVIYFESKVGIIYHSKIHEELMRIDSVKDDYNYSIQLKLNKIDYEDKLDSVCVSGEGEVKVGEKKLTEIELRIHLATLARKARQIGIPSISHVPIIIRCSKDAKFKHIYKVVESCYIPGIRIWRIYLEEDK